MNDTLIFLVLAGLALVFKWLTSQASSDSEKREPPSPNEQAPRRPPPQSEEERVRRFLEALGAPPGTPPPPPVRSRRVVTPAPRTPKPKVKRSWVQPLPPIVTTPEDMPLPPLTTAPVPEAVFVVEAKPPSEVVVPPPLPPVSTFPSAATLRRKAAPLRAAPITSLGALLRSRESIRQAIILREVLGPPRGLEPFGNLQGL